MSDLTDIYTEWWKTLIEMATVFGSPPYEEGLRKTLVSRTDSLRQLEQEFRGRVDLPRFQPAGYSAGRITAYGATQRATEALESLDDLRVHAAFVQRLSGHRSAAEYELAALLNLRWHKLKDLEKLVSVKHVAAWEMQKTVPSDYWEPLLHGKELRSATEEQMAGIIFLHRAAVPAAYAASVVPPSALTPENARRALEMYTEGIPSELAKEVL